jgi:hypothetical protein
MFSEQRGHVGERAARRVEADEQPARALHQHQIVLGGQLGRRLGDVLRVHRCHPGPPGRRSGRQRLGVAGQFRRRDGTGEPGHLVGVAALVRPYAGLRGLQHGHRPAGRERRRGDGGRRDGLADLRVRPRDHQDRHVIPPVPRRTPRARCVPHPRRP